tara:strand:- start:399 stop:617 length:219 start_codon:yes stop_codon:yes gene_type:complete
MKFKEALVMGIACGMTTVDEAIKNIEIHSNNFFVYEKISTELKELYETWEKYGCPESMPISRALEMCYQKEK